MIYLESTWKGLLKNVQNSISKPPGDQDIIQNLRETFLWGTLYLKLSQTIFYNYHRLSQTNIFDYFRELSNIILSIINIHKQLSYKTILYYIINRCKKKKIPRNRFWAKNVQTINVENSCLEQNSESEFRYLAWIPVLVDKKPEEHFKIPFLIDRNQNFE